MVKQIPVFLLLFSIALLGSCSSTGSGDSEAEVFMHLTTPNQQALFERLENRVTKADTESGNKRIEIDPAQTFQTIDGFGYALTGGSAYHLMNMSESARTALLEELYGVDEQSIGVSYIRVSIGASDLDFAPFSYNDLPRGETDPDLSEFSLDPDREYLIPALKEILLVDPDIKIMGSPWSAPAWMKTNESFIGGSLKREYYPVYAQYFVKYIQGMADEGITIDAITIQNEPQHDGNNPSMVMSAIEQRDFVRDHIGPALTDAGIETKIVIWDHNADRPDYPITILNDAEAKEFVDGSAFHLYAGDISAMSQVKEAHPDKNLYFTEQWIGAPGDFPNDLEWHTRNLIVGATRNWSKNVLQWNLAADNNQDPHTQGGCDRCLGAITIEGDSVSRNPGYYIIAHASKYVRPGSVRIHSSELDGFPNVAFKNPADEIVMIVLNDSGKLEQLEVQLDGETYTFSLIPGAVATIVF